SPSLMFQAGDGRRGCHVTGVQTCALPISRRTSTCWSCGWSTAPWSTKRPSRPSRSGGPSVRTERERCRVSRETRHRRCVSHTRRATFHVKHRPPWEAGGLLHVLEAEDDLVAAARLVVGDGRVRDRLALVAVTGVVELLDDLVLGVTGGAVDGLEVRLELRALVVHAAAHRRRLGVGLVPLPL